MIPEIMDTMFSHVVLVTGSRTWNDEVRMRETFNRLWIHWGTETVTRPVLLSGSCPKGADAMAERLWRQIDFKIIPFPADWSQHGKMAGFIRNTHMVDAAQVFRAHGCQVMCTAFFDPCACPQQHKQQLLPIPGHFSHGTAHCRNAAVEAGLEVMDVIREPTRTAHA